MQRGAFALLGGGLCAQDIGLGFQIKVGCTMPEEVHDVLGWRAPSPSPRCVPTIR